MKLNDLQKEIAASPHRAIVVKKSHARRPETEYLTLGHYRKRASQLYFTATEINSRRRPEETTLTRMIFVRHATSEDLENCNSAIFDEPIQEAS